MMRTLLTTMLMVSLAVPAGAAAVPGAARDRPAPEARAARAAQPPRQPRPAQEPRPAQRPRPAPQPRPGGIEQTDHVVREFRLGASGDLDLANISGDITITAGKGDTARIDIIKTARAGSEAEARDLLDLMRVEVVERANRVEIRSSHPQHGGRGPGRRGLSVTVAYRAAVPAGTRVRAHSIAGAITADGIRGESSYESVSGSIAVTNGGRVVSAKSISGEVALTDTEMDTTFQASSASGSVTLRRVKARRLDIGSISGEVVLDQVNAERIQAQAVSGNVHFDGTLARDGRYQLRSHSGDVRVALAGATGFDVDATTFSGSIKSDLPVKSRSEGERGGRGRVLRGIHGDGSAVLELTTFSGSVLITKR